MEEDLARLSLPAGERDAALDSTTDETDAREAPPMLETLLGNTDDVLLLVLLWLSHGELCDGVKPCSRRLASLARETLNSRDWLSIAANGRERRAALWSGGGFSSSRRLHSAVAGRTTLPLQVRSWADRDHVLEHGAAFHPAPTAKVGESGGSDGDDGGDGGDGDGGDGGAAASGATQRRSFASAAMQWFFGGEAGAMESSGPLPAGEYTVTLIHPLGTEVAPDNPALAPFVEYLCTPFGAHQGTIALPPHDGPVWSVAISRFGESGGGGSDEAASLIASGGDDGWVHLWSADAADGCGGDGKRERAGPHSLRLSIASAGPVECVGLRDDTLLLCGKNGPEVRIYRRLLSASSGASAEPERLEFGNRAVWACSAHPGGNPRHESIVQSTYYPSAGGAAIPGLLEWRGRGSAMNLEVPFLVDRSDAPSECLCLAYGRVSGWAEPGGLVVLGCADSRAEVWSYCAPGSSADSAPLSRVEVLQGHADAVYACAVSDGWVATGGDDCTVRLWGDVVPRPAGSTAASTPLNPFQTLNCRGRVWAIAFRNGLLFCGGEFGRVRSAAGRPQLTVELWDVRPLTDRAAPCGVGGAPSYGAWEGARLVRTLHADVEPGVHWGVRSLAFDEHALVAGCDDGFVRVWALRGTGAAEGEGEEGQGGPDGDEN